MTNITIGELAGATGLTFRTIRYYEEIGLIVSCGEKRGNAVLYPEESLSALRKIIILKEAGLGLEEIKSVFRFIRTEETKGKRLTLFLRETLEETRKKIRVKKSALAKIEKTLGVVLERTMRCEECPTKNAEKDCEGCGNLAMLKGFG